MTGLTVLGPLWTSADGTLTVSTVSWARSSVGLSVSGPVREIRLYYTQGVVTAFSHVHVVSAAGAQIPASKPVNDPSDQQIVIIRLGRALGPGIYSVNWQVVSVDTHRTDGSFSFDIAR